jgi:hypothetical protein
MSDFISREWLNRIELKLCPVRMHAKIQAGSPAHSASPGFVPVEPHRQKHATRDGANRFVVFNADLFQRGSFACDGTYCNSPHAKCARHLGKNSLDPKLRT